MPTAKYSNYLEINPSFESVVDIDADTRNTNLWREYIVGDDMESLVEQMCQSIGNEAPDLRRSFWIHGSYGTGKSYAAIFVKHLMEEKPEVVGDFLAASNRLAKYKTADSAISAKCSRMHGTTGSDSPANCPRARRRCIRARKAHRQTDSST